MIDGLKKRKFKRLEIPLEVTVQIICAQDMQEDTPQISIKSRNISKDGICLETKSIELNGVNLIEGPPFARENRLQLTIELFPEEPLFSAIGEVRWYDIDHQVPEFICRLGVAFLEIKDNGKDRLAKFLKRHQTKSRQRPLASSEKYL